MRETYVVDWRSEIGRMSPFLKGRGGVVVIKTTATAPASVFARAIRTLMRQSKSPQWKSVQIESSNASTHYLSDIVIQMHETFGIPLARPEPGHAPSLTIASDIDAGGSVDISDVTVTIANDPFQQLVHERRRIRHLVDSLDQLLDLTRCAVITLDMHSTSREIILQVRQRLWDGALATLTDRGLLLIDISNPDQMPVDPTIWPPPADFEFDLPDRYDDISSAAAREDYARSRCRRVSSPRQKQRTPSR